MKILAELGKKDSTTILIQPVAEGDSSFLENEVSKIIQIAGSEDFRLVPVMVDNWNNDLSPWESDPVFGDEPFGSGACDTLDYILREVVPALKAGGAKRTFIGGYSLAGLFALWACCNTDAFDGAAAVSPSVWFPGFLNYIKENAPKTGAVYLSLGNKEERTKNRTMASVGDCIRSIHEYLDNAGIENILEWNQGGHFNEPDLRVAKGFARLIR